MKAPIPRSLACSTTLCNLKPRSPVASVHPALLPGRPLWPPIERNRLHSNLCPLHAVTSSHAAFLSSSVERLAEGLAPLARIGGMLRLYLFLSPPISCLRGRAARSQFSCEEARVVGGWCCPFRNSTRQTPVRVPEVIVEISSVSFGEDIRKPARVEKSVPTVNFRDWGAIVHRWLRRQ